ncbi:TRAP transporter small permease [Lentibacillus amyloliquefaciens]|nr:TRAP transporter small permease [Lentibacillus amyloliquefaciens]
MKILHKIEEHFVGIGMIAATGILFMNIILRNLFSASTTWAEEFIRYAFIWITFIGLSICFRKGIHFGVDLLMNSLKAKEKKIILQAFVNVASLVFMLFLLKFGLDIVFFSMETGQITPALQIKIYWIYLAIPTGAVLSIIHIVINMWQLFKNKEISYD